MKTVRVQAVVAAVIVLVASSCGGEPGNGDNGGVSPRPTSAAAPAATRAPSTDPGGSTGADTARVENAGEWASVVDAAVEEGSVTLYSFQAQENLDALKEAFEEAYPEITLDVSRVVSSEGPAKLEAERTTGAAGADVYMDPRMAWAQEQLAADDQRLVEPLSPHLTAHHDLLLVECRCVITGFTVVGIGWNSSMVAEPPGSLADIVSEEYRGRIGLPEIGLGNVSFYAQLREYGGDDYWERLAALDPIFYAGGAPLSQGVVAGEVLVTPFAGPAQFGAAKSNGAPVEFAIPSDAPAWGPPFLAHVLGWARHPNAAQLLVDFILSTEGQAALNANGITALPEAVEGTVGSITDVAPFSGDMPADDAEALLAEWHETFGR